jgi:CRP-like cAMP-binding protein
MAEVAGRRPPNRLLAAVGEADFALVEPWLRRFSGEAGRVLFEPGDDVETTYFPLSHAMVSLRIVTPQGDEVEAATIGREGAVGGIVSAGAKPAFGRMLVQLPGDFVTLPTARLEEAKRLSPRLHDLFCRYADVLLAQVMQSVACSALHSVEERAARWMLCAHDRAGEDSFGLSQQALADMLGVQRTTVTGACAALQAKGAVRYSRARITVTDRRTLERTACACHGSVERHFQALLPEAALGG